MLYFSQALHDGNMEHASHLFPSNPESSKIMLLGSNIYESGFYLKTFYTPASRKHTPP